MSVPLMAKLQAAGCIDPFDLILGNKICQSKEQWLGAYVSRAFRQGHMAVMIGDAIVPSVFEVFSNDGVGVLDEQEITYVEEALRKEKEESSSLLISEGELLALPYAYAVEKGLAKEIQRLACATPYLQLLHPIIEEPLNTMQKAAVIEACNAPLCVITGGPGTGKTYTAGSFLRTLDRSNTVHPLRVILAAPTGRAVQTLEKSIRAHIGDGAIIEAKTIHSLICSPHFSFLPYHLAILDECSMIDSDLMLRLLQRLHSGTKVLMLGDADQLPPIDPGQPFFDLLAARRQWGHVALQECQRTMSRQLLEIARCVREEDAHGFEACLGTRGMDLSFIDCEEDGGWSHAEALIEREIYTPWRENLSLKEARLQLRKRALLTPCRNGYWGVESINSRALHRKALFVPVVSTKNSYHLGVMNGDLGVKENGIEFNEVHFPHCTVPDVLLPRCEHAFAMTVHKSQGGEFEGVVVVIPPGALVGRRMLYTAITRAKERLILIGQKKDLMNAIGRREERISLLQRKFDSA